MNKLFFGNVLPFVLIQGHCDPGSDRMLALNEYSSIKRKQSWSCGIPPGRLLAQPLQQKEFFLLFKKNYI